MFTIEFVEMTLLMSYQITLILSGPIITLITFKHAVVIYLSEIVVINRSGH